MSVHCPESHQEVGVHETPGGMPLLTTPRKRGPSLPLAVRASLSQQIESKSSCSSAVRLAPAMGMVLVGAQDRPGGATLLRIAGVPKGVLASGMALFIAVQNENAANRHAQKSFVPDSMIENYLEILPKVALKEQRRYHGSPRYIERDNKIISFSERSAFGDL